MMRIKALEILNTETIQHLECFHGDGTYRAHLCEKEFALFDIVEINRLMNGLKFIVLSAEKWTKIPLIQLNRLVNSFYLMYGEDDKGNGKFNDADLQTLKSGEIWEGRIWMNSIKYKQAAQIRLNEQTGLILQLVFV